MLNYPCPWSAIITSSAEWVYNDHRDCWVFQEELPRHIHTHPQTNSHVAVRVSAQQGPSREVYRSQACHWPASSIPASPMSSLAPIITTSLCLHLMLHPSPHTNYTLHQDWTDSVCVSVTAGVHVCMCVWRTRKVGEPREPPTFPSGLCRPL